MQGYRLPSRRDALTATAATTAVAAARRTLPTESRKRGSHRDGGDTCIPRRPLAAGPTPAYIHPQGSASPKLYLFLSRSPFLLLYTFAVCSLIIQRFFLSPFSSKLCAPLRLVLYYTCSSFFSLTLFLPVNDFSALCIFLPLRRIPRGPFRSTTHAIHSILLYSLLYFSGSSHFSL